MCVSAERTGENKAGKMMEKEVCLLNWQGGGKKSEKNLLKWFSLRSKNKVKAEGLKACQISQTD